MEVYSPSHPTDQDAEGDPQPHVEENVDLTEEKTSHSSTIEEINLCSSSPGCAPENADVHDKSPELSPTLTDSSNQRTEVADDTEAAPKDNKEAESQDVDTTLVADQVRAKEDEDTPLKELSKSPQDKEKPHSNGDTEKGGVKKDSADRKSSSSKSSDKKDEKERHSNKEKGPSSYRDSDKSGRHSTSRSTRNRSRSPRRRRSSRSPDRRGSRKRSTSRSHARHSHSRRRSRTRSRDRDRHYRRSRSSSRDRRDRRGRDSHRDHRLRSRSRDHQDSRLANDSDKSRRDRLRESEKIPLPLDMPNPTIPLPPLPPPVSIPPPTVAAVAPPESEEQYDMDETSTPDISEEQQPPPPPMQGLNESVAYMLQNRPPPPPPPLTTAPNLMNWQQQPPPPNPPFIGQPSQPVVTNALIQQAFQQQQQQQQQRPGGFGDCFPPRPAGIREFPPNLMTQRPAFNPANRFPGAPPQLMAMNGILNPLLPFGGLLGQPPPPPPPPPALPNLPFATQPPPPPPFIQHIQQPPRLPFSQHQPPPSPPQTVSGGAAPPNLLETLMSKAGLSTDGIAGLGGGNSRPSGNITAIPLPGTLAGPSEEKSPMKKMNKLLSTAANTLLSHFNTSGGAVAGGGSGSPPPPPPPPPLPMSSVMQQGPSRSRSPGWQFVPPPLPALSGESSNAALAAHANGNGNGAPTTGDEEKQHKPRLVYNKEEMLSKRRRSEFSTTREWQERIALEVRSFIKPSYAAGRVSKEDCRTILKKSVNKVRRHLSS